MKKLWITLVVLALFAGPLALTAAAVDYPDIDPKDGTVIATLAPVNDAPKDAWGKAVINYQKGRDTFQVQVNVKGLATVDAEGKPCKYSVLFMNVGTSPRLEVPITVDAKGNGQLHLTVDAMPTIDRVNVRMLNVESSARLTSTEHNGGAIRQVPSKRNK